MSKIPSEIIEAIEKSDIQTLEKTFPEFYKIRSLQLLKNDDTCKQLDCHDIHEQSLFDIYLKIFECSNEGVLKWMFSQYPLLSILQLLEKRSEFQNLLTENMYILLLNLVMCENNFAKTMSGFRLLEKLMEEKNFQSHLIEIIIRKCNKQHISFLLQLIVKKGTLTLLKMALEIHRYSFSNDALTENLIFISIRRGTFTFADFICENLNNKTTNLLLFNNETFKKALFLQIKESQYDIRFVMECLHRNNKVAKNKFNISLQFDEIEIKKLIRTFHQDVCLKSLKWLLYKHANYLADKDAETEIAKIKQEMELKKLLFLKNNTLLLDRDVIRLVIGYI